MVVSLHRVVPWPPQQAREESKLALMVLVNDPITFLDEGELADLVAEAMETRCPLDQLVVIALYGSAGGAPEKWGDWAPEAKAAWDFASRMWDDVQSEKRDREDPPDVVAVWSAVAKLVTLAEWPLVPYLTWSDMATVLEVRPRFITYHCSTKQGWRFQGRYAERTTLRAPCIRCGAVLDAGTIHDRIGDCCAGAA